MPIMGHSSPWAALIGGLFCVFVEYETKPRAGFGLGTKMDMQEAIALKRMSEPPAEPRPSGAIDRLDALGQLLYGEHWIGPMARDLKICPDTIANWALGKCELPPDNPIFGALAVLVHYHDKGLAKARQIIDRQRA
jgi:hypothetical protein